MGKIWIISDTHFGIKNNSKQWEDIMFKWANDFFFPLLEKKSSPDDILVHCGDVFDNRQSIGLSAMNLCICFFEQLSEYFNDIFVLCGNHDAYYTTKNDITSIDCLKHISKVHIIKKPVLKNIFNKNVAFIPWTEDTRVFKNMLNNEKQPDICFCHAEFYGCTMNSFGTKSEKDLRNPDILRIYSGHIHHRHKYKNTNYVGSPYQLSQNERNNSKCVLVYNPENDTEQTYLNNVSPEFMREKYENVSNLSLKDFKLLCKNKFVEIETDGTIMPKCRFQKIFSLINEDDNIFDLTFVPTNKENTVLENINISDCASLSEMVEKYINETVTCDPQIKKYVMEISKKLIHG